MVDFWKILTDILIPVVGVIFGAFGGVLLAHRIQRARPAVHVDRISVTSNHGEDIFDTGLDILIEASLERFSASIQLPQDDKLLTERDYASYLEKQQRDLTTWRDQTLPRLLSIVKRCIELTVAAKDDELHRYLTDARMRYVDVNLERLRGDENPESAAREASNGVVKDLVSFTPGPTRDGELVQSTSRDEILQGFNGIERKLQAKLELAKNLVDVLNDEIEKYYRLLINGVVSNLGRTPVSLGNEGILIVNLFHAGRLEKVVRVGLKIGASYSDKVASSPSGDTAPFEHLFGFPIVVRPGESLNVIGVSMSRMYEDNDGDRLLREVRSGSSPARLQLNAIGSQSKRFHHIDSRNVSFGQTVQRASIRDEANERAGAHEHRRLNGVLRSRRLA